jgi:hypothetical protein
MRRGAIPQQGRRCVMSVRHSPNRSGNPRVPSPRDTIEGRQAQLLSIDREIESKVVEGDAWIDREPHAEDDFDVAAWYALEVEADHDRLCISECWFG